LQGFVRATWGPKRGVHPSSISVNRKDLTTLEPAEK
jgi:hypothetical protein